MFSLFGTLYFYVLSMTDFLLCFYSRLSTTKKYLALPQLNSPSLNSLDDAQQSWLDSWASQVPLTHAFWWFLGILSEMANFSLCVYFRYHFLCIPKAKPKFFIPRIGMEVLLRGSHIERQQPLRKAQAKLDCVQPSLRQGFHKGIPLRVRVMQWRPSMREHLESELAKPMRWCSINKGILILTVSQISSIAHNSKTEESLGH